MLENFHFLRPVWLLLVPMASVVLFALWRSSFQQSDWQRECDPEMLKVLLVGGNSVRQWLPFFGLGLLWLIGSIALAGPSWDRQPVPTYRSAHDRVIVFDLSRSMDSTDLQPSRLAHGRFKLVDLVSGARERQQGLVVFAGDAFIVSPLTDDYQTLTNLIPSLDTETVPVQGSRSDKGLSLALELLSGAASKSGEVILITDGVNPESDEVVHKLASLGHRLHILGAGTTQGAPIPIADGSLLKNTNGDIVIPTLDEYSLKRLANRGNGRYLRMQTNNDDILRLNTKPKDGFDQLTLQRNATGLEGSNWIDRGVWLLIPLLLIGSLAFRRGWLLLALLFTLPTPEQALAFGWTDLWLRPDQQASQVLESGNPESVPVTASPGWRGTGAYRSGNYADAIQQFSETESDDTFSIYNRGNALALSGDFEQALAAYDQTLSLNPDHTDAQFNRDIVSKLMQQQQSQSEQSTQSTEESDKERQQNEQQQQQQQGSENSEPTDQQSMDQNNPQPESPNNQQSNQQSTQLNEPAEPNETSNDGSENPSQGHQSNTDKLTAEQRQALEQWIRQVPDDPGGLLQRKFRYQYSLRSEQTKEIQQW